MGKPVKNQPEVADLREEELSTIAGGAFAPQTETSSDVG
jgi:hypothetical protein